MSRASGSVDLIGSVAFVHDTREKILLSDKIFRIYLNRSIDPEFFSDLMKSHLMRTQIIKAISGAEGMANNIAKTSILEFLFPLPPKNEQIEIKTRLDKQSGYFDNLIGKSESAVKLLQERRTALISAAVTGKIDLRDWQAA